MTQLAPFSVHMIRSINDYDYGLSTSNWINYRFRTLLTRLRLYLLQNSLDLNVICRERWRTVMLDGGEFICSVDFHEKKCTNGRSLFIYRRNTPLSDQSIAQTRVFYGYLSHIFLTINFSSGICDFVKMLSNSGKWRKKEGKKIIKPIKIDYGEWQKDKFQSKFTPGNNKKLNWTLLNSIR